MTRTTPNRALSVTQVDDLARRVREVLADPDADLSPSRRARFEGVLTACEIIAGRVPSLAGDEIGGVVRELL